MAPKPDISSLLGAVGRNSNKFVFTEERAAAAKNTFIRLDSDSSGSIELNELCVIASRLTPAENMKEAMALMVEMDENRDGKVTLTEFLTAIERISTGLSDKEFYSAMSNKFSPDEEAVMGVSYVPPLENRDYLEREVLPSLKPVLINLLARMEDEYLRLAIGEDWDEGGYRREGWQPFNPLTWLAAALREQKAKNILEKGQSDGQQKQLINMTRLEQAEVVMAAMNDESGASSIDVLSVIDGIAGRFGTDETRGKVFAIIERQDVAEPGQLTNKELETVLSACIGAQCTDATFTEGIESILKQIKFDALNREQKIEECFRGLDKDGSGELELDEILALSQMLKPGSTLKQAKETMSWMDENNDNIIQVEEFVEAMSRMTADIEEKQFVTGISKILEAFADETQSIDGTTSMPFHLRECVRMIPSYKTAKHKSTEYVHAIVGDDEEKVVLIDARSLPEYEVSSIAGAMHMDVDEHGDLEASVAEAVSKLDLADVEALSTATIIVFDTIGERSGLASIAIGSRLDMPVYNLCGGLVNWFNNGFPLVDQEGNEVKSLHPFRPELKGLITTENNYELL